MDLALGVFYSHYRCFTTGKLFYCYILMVLIYLGFHTECEQKKEMFGDKFLFSHWSICGFGPLSFTQANVGVLCETCGVFRSFPLEVRKVIFSYQNRSISWGPSENWADSSLKTVRLTRKQTSPSLTLGTSYIFWMDSISSY